MDTRLLKDALGWGFTLWLIGYILGLAVFPFVPVAAVGWIVMPIGVALALWVLLGRVKSTYLRYYLALAVVWTLLAVVLDYFLLVKMFNPTDGYYKLDVYLYYALTFLLPLGVGLSKVRLRSAIWGRHAGSMTEGQPAATGTHRVHGGSNAATTAWR